MVPGQFGHKARPYVKNNQGIKGWWLKQKVLSSTLSTALVCVCVPILFPNSSMGEKAPVSLAPAAFQSTVQSMQLLLYKTALR
jgi:hypothetical protein